jgi:hypothetical protein
MAFGLVVGVILAGALTVCAIASLFRNPRRVVMETQAPRGPRATLPRASEASLAAQGRAPVVIEPVTYSGLNKTQAEELLDWLHANGYHDCELSFDEQAGFTVRCR